MNIVVSTVGVFLWFLLWVLKGGRLLKAEGNADTQDSSGVDGDGKGTGDKDWASKDATKGRKATRDSDVELADVYRNKEISSSAVNPLHEPSIKESPDPAPVEVYRTNPLHTTEAEEQQSVDVASIPAANTNNSAAMENSLKAPISLLLIFKERQNSSFTYRGAFL